MLLAFAVGVLGCSPTPTAAEEVEDAAVEVAAAAPARRDPKEVWEKMRPHLLAADDAFDDAVVVAAKRVNAFFRSRQPKTRDFAENALGLRAKWRLVKSKLPGADEDGFRAFLREQFEECVFSRKELGDVLESAVAECVQTWQGVENDLLVRLAADVGDGDLAAMKARFDLPGDAAVREAMRRAMDEVVRASGPNLGVAAGGFALSLVGGEVAASLGRGMAVSVAKRLGVAAVLGAGAASFVATGAVAIVAGFAIDYLIQWVLLEVGYDPVGDVSDETEIAVDQFHEVLVFGVPLPPIPPRKYRFKETNDRAQRFYRLEMERYEDWKRRNPCAGQDAGFMWELRQYCALRTRVRDAAMYRVLCEGVAS
jgi:hypothetical protein